MKIHKLQVVVPMAGRGQRFQDAGFVTPKPMIMVDGHPMFLKALRSLDDLNLETEIHFVIRNELDVAFNISNTILKYCPKARIKSLASETRGAAETVLTVIQTLDKDLPILILDADLAFRSPDFLESIECSSNMDGHLLSFNSTNPRYSFVRESNGIAIEVVEKKAISNKALIGAYYWSKAIDFHKHADTLIKKGISEQQKEFYISSVVQLAIENGMRFAVSEGEFTSFGTPEEMAFYQNSTS